MLVPVAHGACLTAIRDSTQSVAGVLSQLSPDW